MWISIPDGLLIVKHHDLAIVFAALSASLPAPIISE
jgi:hypothetical protein